MPKGAENLRVLIKKFSEKHTPIKDNFCSGVGRILQKKDSDIAEDILLYFQKKDIPVLPVHDSFIIAQEHEQDLEAIMKSAYHDIFKQEIQVDRKI